jgi:hypothetical protein
MSSDGKKCAVKVHPATFYKASEPKKKVTRKGVTELRKICFFLHAVKPIFFKF